MFRPTSRHWFAVALCLLAINAGGMALLLRWGYLHREGVRIVSAEPEGAAAEVKAVSVAFDREMVAPGRVGEVLARSPMWLTPRVDGDAVWQGPRTLAFVPAKPLPRATPFVANVVRSLRSLDGHRLVGRSTFEFHTEPLRWLGARQVDMAGGRPTICLTFNHAVQPAQVGKHLRLLGAHQEPLDFGVMGHTVSDRAYVRTDDPTKGKLTAVLAAGLRGVSGPLGLTEEQTQPVDLLTRVEITNVHARVYSGARPYLAIESTMDLATKDAAKHIRIEPAVAFHMEDYYWRETKLAGDFEHGAQYRVTFGKGLQSESGLTLGREMSWTVRVPDAPPQVVFAGRGAYLSTRSSLRVPVDCMNVESISVSAEKIYTNNIVHYLNARWGTRLLGHDLPERTVRVKGRRNAWTRAYLDLRELLGEALPGPTVIRVRSRSDRHYSASKLVLATNIGLTVKCSSHDVLVWTNAIDDTSAVAGARVALLSRKNQLVAEGVTDSDGLLHLRGLDFTGERRPSVVTASKDGDLSYVALEEGAVSTAGFDVVGDAPLRTGYEAFVYTERGIYRPGEQVRLNALVRGLRLGLPEQFPVEFQVRRPDRRVACRRSVRLSELGAAREVFAVHPEAQTGRYSVRVAIPGEDKPMGSATFLVEEFVPDRMKVEVELPPGPVEPGGRMAIVVKGAHLLGHPAAGRQASCRCVLEPCAFQHPKWPRYTFLDRTREHESHVEDLGEHELAGDGRHKFVLRLPDRRAAPGRLRVKVSASLRELGGRAVSAYAEKLLDLHPLYVGVARPEPDPAHPGGILIRCAAVAPDGQPHPVRELAAVFEKCLWHTVLKQGSDRRYRYESEVQYVPVAKSRVRVADGRGVLQLRPRGAGEYRVRVFDPKHGAAASVEFWASGQGHTSWAMRRPDRVKVTTDRPVYAPGDVARIVVRSPFAGKLALFVENDGVRAVQLLELKGNTAEVSVPIRADFGPTAYFVATVIRPLQRADRGAAHRAIGIRPVYVRGPHTRLAVRLAGPDEIRPNTLMRVPFHVTGHDGRGAAAEVTLAAVDVGVCQITGFLTPDPWYFFHSKRRLVQRTSDVYGMVQPEYLGVRMGASSSPAGDAASGLGRLLNPIAVRRVQPAAIWLGAFMTDAQGAGVAEFTTPDFQGRLRLMAVAAGREAVGCGERECAVAAPVLVTVSFPRFLSAGDECQVPVAITNRTASPGQASVEAHAAGAVEWDASEPQQVLVPAGTEKVVHLGLRALALPGKAQASVVVRLNGECVTRRVELAARPAAPRLRVGDGGFVEPGQRRAIRLPGNLLEHGLERKLHVSGLPGVALGRALDYLLRYPYGCAEQTTSAAFPLLYASDIAEAVAPDRFEKQTVDEFVRAGIDRLLMMQTPSGGFGYWPGDSRASPWLSAYAGHFLVSARGAGHSVPARSLDELLGYLETQVSRERGDVASRCYGCYVLALAGRPQKRWTDKLAESPDDLWLTSRCHLAAALLTAGEPARAEALLGSQMPPDITKRMRGGSLRSHARECAILLATLLDHAASDPRVPPLVRRLNHCAQNGRWATTQENAFALFALGKYVRRLARQRGDFVATLTAGAKPVATVSSAKPQTIALAPGLGRDLDLSVAGTGRAYYHWTVDGVPADGRAPERDCGIKARRSYLDREGKPVADLRFRQGEVYQVQITLQVPDPLEHVVVVDLLPAGLEIENPRLSTRQKPGSRRKARLRPQRLDMRDDRLIAFFHLDRGKPQEFRYLVRAVTQGRFQVGPVRAECMYDPDIWSTHGAGRCVVSAH